MESKCSAGEPSMYSTPQERGNDGNEYASDLLEEILHRDNLNLAYKRVKANKGSHGIDGMTVHELLQYLKENGAQLRQSILEGTYTPQPVRRVEIPKPDGGKRMLGIPTVVDRVIQQAISQILSPIYEMQFSANSYGFRPRRNAYKKRGPHRAFLKKRFATPSCLNQRTVLSFRNGRHTCFRVYPTDEQSIALVP